MVAHNFIDHVRICCRSGKGGDGYVHFHRAKYVPKGGPDGGDGSRGGHIVLRGSKQRWTLLHLRYQKHVIAEDGKSGGSQNKTGRQGKDLIIDVPLGTQVKDIETGELLGEVLEEGETFIVARGGRGGRGNHHFKSSTNQAPDYAEEGGRNEEKWVILELKLLADVGMVGYPNAGKSTLLSVLSAAKPEIADYPFTTITPNLGVVPYNESHSFVMADIPGLIEGAHSGKGMGTRFLRHTERNTALLFLISAEELEPAKQYRELLHELEQYEPGLLNKKRLMAITKADLLDDELKAQLTEDLPNNLPPYVFVSALTGEGLPKLKGMLWDVLQEEGVERGNS